MNRTFELADQAKFAALSGDINPAHTDVVAARKTLFGGVAVHGVHLLLWFLETQLRGWGPVRLTRLDADFVAPVLVGDQASCDAYPNEVGELAGRVTVRGTDALRLRVAYVPDGLPRDAPALQPAPIGQIREWSDADLGSYSGSLDLCADPAGVADLFPGLAQALPADQVAVPLALTRLVGMECPGRHSILTSLKIRFVGNACGVELRCVAESWRPDFRMLQLSAKGLGVEAEVTALVRPAPVVQPRMAGIVRRVAPGLFAGRNAIVVGGSRGLGQVAAKILAAGGGSVLLSYVHDHAGADSVVDEIRRSGGSAAAFRLDVSTDHELPIDAHSAHWRPTDLLYFATPRIVLNETTCFQPELFRAYTAFYVEHFYALAAHFAALPGGRRRLFYPSTNALDRVLPKASEYASAKAAGEALCRHLPRIFGNLDVVCERLPRVLTDQTASVLETAGADAFDTVYQFLTASPLPIDRRPNSET